MSFKLQELRSFGTIRTERTWIGEAADKVVAKEVKESKGEQKNMGTNCNYENEGTGALTDVLLYWCDEVSDRIGELIGREIAAVREASATKVFVDQMAAQIVEFERQGGESTVESEARAKKRTERLRSLLMDWVEVPRGEADKARRLERLQKDAFTRLEDEFESLAVRSKVVRPGDEAEWLRAVGIYKNDGFDFDVEGDAQRFIRAVGAVGDEI